MLILVSVEYHAQATQDPSRREIDPLRVLQLIVYPAPIILPDRQVHAYALHLAALHDETRS